MPTPIFTGLKPKPTFEDVCRKINELADELTNLMVNLDDANFDKITANVMDVQELSAITANLGTITAGVLQAVTIIGSLIQTQLPGQYPRIELSSTGNLLTAEKDADSSIEIRPGGIPTPNLSFTYFSEVVNLALGATGFIIGAISNNISLIAGNSIDLSASSGSVNVPSWSKLYNYATNRTLQQELNDLSARITALGG